MRSATLSLAAERDLLEATRWITKDNPAAARALRSAVERAAMTIGELGRLRPEVVGAPYRSLSLIGLAYVIIYNAERIPPRIMRCGRYRGVYRRHRFFDPAASSLSDLTPCDIRGRIATSIRSHFWTPHAELSPHRPLDQFLDAALG
jgi:toxin ParE1/3/4